MDEAAAALAGGCDILDVKEPFRGPLGMADPEVLRDIASFTRAWNKEHGSRIPVSVALGDSVDWKESTPPLPDLDVDFVKLGTAGAAGASWPHLWKAALVRAFPQTYAPRRIIVAYADHRHAGAPAVLEVLEAANALECTGLLIDTWSKDAGWLGDWLSTAELVQLRREASRLGLTLAIAGGLTSGRLESLADVHPDIVGIRGAACAGGLRTGEVAKEAVAAFRNALAVRK